MAKDLAEVFQRTNSECSVGDDGGGPSGYRSSNCGSKVHAESLLESNLTELRDGGEQR